MIRSVEIWLLFSSKMEKRLVSNQNKILNIFKFSLIWNGHCRWLTSRSLWAPSIKYILYRVPGNLLLATYITDLLVEDRCNKQIFQCPVILFLPNGRATIWHIRVVPKYRPLILFGVIAVQCEFHNFTKVILL